MEEEKEIEEFNLYASKERERKIYIKNPSTPYLGEVLKKKNNITLYEKFTNPDGKGVEKVPYSNKYDKRDKVSVYLDEIFFHKIVKLNIGATKLLFFIMMEIPNLSDYLIINKDKFLRLTNYSSQYYRKILLLLVEEELIFESPNPNMYFINSLFLVKGTALELFKKYQITEGKEKLLWKKKK